MNLNLLIQLVYEGKTLSEVCSKVGAGKARVLEEVKKFRESQSHWWRNTYDR